MNRKLIYYPDDVLKKECRPVDEPGQWVDLIDDMRTILYKNNGVGLAASQVGEPIQLFLLNLDPEDQVDEVYINPEIVEVHNPETISEGCLSFPDVTVDIERGTEVTFRADTPGDKRIERTLEGLQAQCVQHEFDHLHGQTLVDHCGLEQKMKIDEALKS